MAQLAYYCAMESLPISVINGNEKGGSSTKIKQTVHPNLLHKLQKNYHAFLDNLTGDIFSYNQDTQAWHPLGNVGLHNIRYGASIQKAVCI